MRRQFFCDAVAAGLSTMPAEQRFAVWKELERDFARAWSQAHPAAPAAGYEGEWLQLAREIAARLSAIEARR